MTQEALATLAGMRPDEHVDIAGSSYSVEDVRDQIRLELVVYAANSLTLMLVMLAAFVVAKRAPLMACVLALLGFIAVQTYAAFSNPDEILRGSLYKIATVGLLLRGLRAELVDRGLRLGPRAVSTGG